MNQLESAEIDQTTFIQVCFGVKDKTYQENKEFYHGIFTDAEITAWTYPNDDVYELEFKIHQDQSDFWKHENEIDYFGYVRKNEKEITMIHSSIGLFSMCFANGFEIEVKKGKGIAYRLELISEKFYSKSIRKEAAKGG